MTENITRVEFSGQEVHPKIISEKHLGPRLYMARLIVPVPVSTIKDIENLKSVYEKNAEREKIVVRHAIPKAVDIDLFNMSVEEINQKCSGLSKDIIESARKLVGEPFQYHGRS